MGKEKKEIGKLLELLNEYLSPFSGYIHYHNGNGFKRTPTKSAVEGDRMLQDEYVLGKSFGFIKWLVENDKIDLWSNTFTEKEEHYFGEQPDFTFQSVKYTHLLMLLSISDTPTEDLILYLK